MSTARSMAKAMHQYMVKSSAGVFRARFVVPLCDWPSILEADENEYDSVSTTIDEHAGRTRLGGGVLVTELAGPRTHNRVLCVTAHTASVFVTVLHRLLSGFAGNDEDVTTRLLVTQEDFELATSGNGRGGLEAAVDELRRAAAVRIDDGFERFHVYPLAGETAMRIVGRPSAVVRCVCLVNEMLCETTTAATALLVDTDRQLPDDDWLEYSTRQPDPIDWNAIFEPSIEQYLPSSPISLSNYAWPESEPRPTSPYWGILNFDTDIYNSPPSPAETSTHWPTIDTRPASPTSSVSCQAENRNRSPRFAAAAANRPTTPFRRCSGRRVANRQVSPSRVTTNATTATTTVIPRTAICIQSAPNRRMFRNQSRQGAAAARSIGSWSAPDRIVNRNPSPLHTTGSSIQNDIAWSVANRLLHRYESSRVANVNVRPSTSCRSASERPVNRNPSQHLGTTPTTTVTTSPATSCRSVSERLVNRNPSSSVTAIVTNSTADRNATPARSVSDRLITNRQHLPSRVTTKATATTSTTDRIDTPIRSVSDRLNRKQSSSCVTTNATASGTTATSARSVSDRLVNRNPSSAAIGATDQNATTYLSEEHQAAISRQLSSLRVTTKANTAINRHATCVRSVSDRLVNRNPSPRVPINETTANTDHSDISIFESEDSSQSDLN